MSHAEMTDMDNEKHDFAELDKPIQPGIYPVIDDDVPRDNSFDNFPPPGLRDLHPYS